MLPAVKMKNSLARCWRLLFGYRGNCMTVYNVRLLHCENWGNFSRCTPLLLKKLGSSSQQKDFSSCTENWSQFLSRSWIEYRPNQILFQRRYHSLTCTKICDRKSEKLTSLCSNLVKKTAGLLSAHNTYSTKVAVSTELLGKYLDKLSEEYEEIQSNKSREKTDSIKRGLYLKPLIDIREEFKEKVKEYEDLNKLIVGLDASDEEIRYMAEQEKREYRKKIDDIKKEVLMCLVPEERTDKNDIILEVTQGVGGQEAMLFASEMLELYAKYAKYKNWDFEITSCDRSELGGVRKGSATISGMDVYRHLKFEAGVHRVQRVPVTEKTGRMHTSTITVSVLPQPTEIDVVLNPKELKIKTTTATGKGGQHVNKTESAVMITHIPTGIIVYCEETRSQHMNKERALKTLRTKLFARELRQKVTEFKTQRKLQVGSAARNEKIRTYNFPQDRISDHRLQENFFNMVSFMRGEEDMDYMNHQLQETSRIEILQEILTDFENDLKKETG